MTTKSKLATVASIVAIAACAAVAYFNFVSSDPVPHDSVQLRLTPQYNGQQQAH